MKKKQRLRPLAPPRIVAAFGVLFWVCAGCTNISAGPPAEATTAAAVQNAIAAPAPLSPLSPLSPLPSTPVDPQVMTVVPTAAVTPTAMLITPVASLLPTPTPQQLAQALLLPTPTPTAALTATIPSEPTPDGVQRTIRVPILMYHYLSTPPPDADIYRKDLSVPPELFAAQLDRLQAEGYTTISLYQLQAYLMQGAPLPEKPVIITFDDGYRDNYEHAFLLLRDRGMTATFFVVTDFIDEARPAYLTWDMAREMHAGGMSIESHGRNHASLQGQDTDYLVWQALGSLETIQYELGVRPRFVSYPAGEFDQLTIDIFASANYWAGVTTVQGTTLGSDDPFRFTRVRVRNTTTPDDLIRLMTLDW